MSASQKRECPAGAGHIAEKSTGKADIVAARSADRNEQKHTATLIARFALAGFEVHRLEGGAFLVCRWNQARHCGDVDALSAFARMVGVQP
jgi:hypothetical protein